MHILNKKTKKKSEYALKKLENEKAIFGEIKVIDIKTKEENNKYEKSWKEIIIIELEIKRVKAVFIWKTIKSINDTWRIERKHESFISV